MDTSERIEVMYNPKEYSVSKSVDWAPPDASAGDHPPLTFRGGRPATFGPIELFFDTYGDKMDVRKKTEKIAKLMEARFKEEGEGDKLRPPIVKFHWGLTWSFKAVVTNVTQRFTLFLATGTPVRATV